MKITCFKRRRVRKAVIFIYFPIPL